MKKPWLTVFLLLALVSFAVVVGPGRRRTFEVEAAHLRDELRDFRRRVERLEADMGEDGQAWDEIERIDGRLEDHDKRLATVEKRGCQ